MKSSVLIICALSLSMGTTSKADLKAYEKAAIATRFAAEVKYNYAGYGQFAQDFDSICRAELPNLVNTSTDEEFGRQLQLLAARLQDAHTSISYRANMAYAPISQRRVGDKVFVTEVYSNEYKRRGVRKGTEIIAINGMPVLEYGRKYVVPFISSSTQQWSDYYPFNSVNLTRGPRGEDIILTFKNTKEEPFDIVDNRQTPGVYRVNPSMEIFYENMPGNIGYLKIPSFQTNKFNMDSFSDIYEHKILNTDGLIIDIRENLGGNGGIGNMIMKLLATDSIPQAAWDTPRYDAAYASYGEKWHTTSVDSDPIVPYFMLTDEVPKYDKPIVLLVNGCTLSAAEDFTVLFKNAKRGIIMGTPTGGSTGNPIMIDLGWGYSGRICTRHERLADGTEFIGVGIQPDILVTETEGVIMGDDNVLKEALKIFKK